MNKLIPVYVEQKLKSASDITLPPEERAKHAQEANAIFQYVAGKNAPAPAKPSYDQWLAAAKKANPGKKDAELKAYYDQKYGG